MARYKVTLTVDGANIKSVIKQATQAFGADAGAQVEKQSAPTSRADRLSAAESSFEDAKSEVESLKEELEQWKENLPENLQDGSKGGELDEAIQELEEILSNMESVEFGNVSFPGMY